MKMTDFCLPPKKYTDLFYPTLSQIPLPWLILFLQIFIPKSNVYLNKNATLIWSEAACVSLKYQHQISLNYLQLSSPCFVL